MPNHIVNVLKFETKEIADKARAIVTTDESQFDFNKIIQMPPELEITEGSVGSEAAKFLNGDITYDQLPEYMKKDPAKMEEALELGRKYIVNREKYGYPTWYGWSCHHWGTKWNAYEVEWLDDVTIRFETAWSFPAPVICKLSEMLGDDEFTFQYADEDTGFNVGEGLAKLGILDCQDVPAGSKRAYEIAFELRPDTEQYYKYDEDAGTYVYKDEE